MLQCRARGAWLKGLVSSTQMLLMVVRGPIVKTEASRSSGLSLNSLRSVAAIHTTFLAIWIVRWNHLFELWHPSRHLVWEALLQDSERDSCCCGGSWRGTQEAGNASIVRCYDFCAELEETAAETFSLLGLHDADALARVDQIPVCRVGIWVIPPQGVHHLLAA